MINWKAVAKYFRTQFLLWVDAYNEIAVPRTAGTIDTAVTYTFTWEG